MKTFRELVGEAIGEASMCWSETPKGTFDSERASKLANEIATKHERLVEYLIALESQVNGMKTMLNALDECGVTDWDGYENAMRLTKKRLRSSEKIKKIIEKIASIISELNN